VHLLEAQRLGEADPPRLGRVMKPRLRMKNTRCSKMRSAAMRWQLALQCAGDRKAE